MSIFRYIIWHYFVAPAWIFELASNYLKGTWHRFLIGRHLATLFAPWHRSQPSDLGKKSDFADSIINFISDIYIRIIAAFMRLGIILAGLLWCLGIFIFSLVGFVAWIFWPLLVVLSLMQGLSLVI